MKARMAGLTLLELLVVIAVIAIATAVAAPDLSSWEVNSRIREAAGHVQEDMQWARSYALKAGQPVYVRTGFVSVAGGGKACWWTASLSASGTPVLSNAPNMDNPNTPTPGVPPKASFAARYPDVSCQYVELGNGGLPPIAPPPANTTYYLAFYPDGTILSSTTGATGSYQLTEGALLMNARANAGKYAQWLAVYYGSGELRSCATQSGGAAMPPYSCVLS